VADSFSGAKEFLMDGIGVVHANPNPGARMALITLRKKNRTAIT
jgi:hypothetical protein